MYLDRNSALVKASIFYFPESPWMMVFPSVMLKWALQPPVHRIDGVSVGPGEYAQDGSRFDAFSGV